MVATVSAEEQSYVRHFINTDDDFQKLLERPAAPEHDVHNQSQQQQMSGEPPVIPPRGNQTIGRTRGTHQDIFVPSLSHDQSNDGGSQPLQELFNPRSTSNQPPAPTVPPRPGFVHLIMHIQCFRLLQLQLHQQHMKDPYHT